MKGLKVNCELMAREGGEQIAGLVSRFLRDHGKNELSGIQSTFATQTEWLLSNPIARDLEKGNWIFAQLREKPTTVSIILPPDEIKDKRRWTRLLFTCALCEHLKPGPVSTLFILDEFRVAVGHLKLINNFWSLVRGYGVQFLVVCQSVLHLKTLFKEEWEIYAGQAGSRRHARRTERFAKAEWMSRRAGTRTETRTSQNEGQGVNTQGISISSGETVSQTETAFKSAQELMSIRVGTGRIWTPGAGNTSIPFFAPNYWKQPDVRPLIDPNPYSGGAQCAAAPSAAPAPVTHNRAVPTSNPAYRRVAMGCCSARHWRSPPVSAWHGTNTRSRTPCLRRSMFRIGADKIHSPGSSSRSSFSPFCCAGRCGSSSFSSGGASLPYLRHRMRPSKPPIGVLCK